MLDIKKLLIKILTLLKTHDTKLGYASNSLIQHTCTYISNRYVTAENFSGLKLEQFKGTRIGILHFLLYITAALPSNTWVTIGSLPITPSSGINQYVPGSDSTHPPIYVAVTATGDNAGKIRLRVFDTSSLTAQGWYRAEIPVVLPYRTS